MTSIFPNLKAVFFDAGETLLAPHPSHHELFSTVLAEHGHRVGPERVQQTFAEMAPTFIAVMDRMKTTEWSTSKEASRAFWGRMYGEALDKMGVPDPGRAIFDALYARYTRYDSYRLFPECASTLEEVRDAGYVVGLISNFEEWLEGLLDHFEVNHLFDPIVISGVEGVEKPNPAIFELALERSGVGAAESLYVGDHPKLDVDAAQAVGMSAVLIDRKSHHPDFEGIKISRLDELLDLLEMPAGERHA